MTRLRAQAPPALPLASETYERRFFNQFGNALRLFFNEVTSFCNVLAGDVGGSYVKFPYGAFSSAVNQVAAAPATAYVVALEVTDMANGVTRSGNQLTANQAGVYNVQFSIQFENSTAGIKEADVWLRKNGTTDVPGTGSVFGVDEKHGAVNGYTIGVANFYVLLSAGDFIELIWATNAVGLIMEAYAAQAAPYVRPSVPSVVLTMTFVSAE